MAAEREEDEHRRRSEFMQAITTEHFFLQSARSLSGTEIAIRSSLYFTTLSSAVVALALVAQVSRLGEAFRIFPLVILPVVFFIGLVSYGRMLQNQMEFIIYGRSIDRIHQLYAEIEPSRAHYFQSTQADGAALAALGLFKLRWQQFLTITATIAIVNGVVAGVFVALVVSDVLAIPGWAATAVGAAVALLIAAVFLRHQWQAWRRLQAALGR